MIKHLTDKSKGNYTKSDNTFLRDPNLTWRAKGIFQFLLSLPKDFNPPFTFLEEQSKEKKTAVRNAISELVDNGYLELIEVEQKEKHLRFYDFILYENGNKFNDNGNINVLRKSKEGMQKIKRGYAENQTLIITNNKYYIYSDLENFLFDHVENSEERTRLIENINHISENLNDILLHTQVKFNQDNYEKHISTWIKKIVTTGDYKRDKQKFKTWFINSHLKKGSYTPKKEEPIPPYYKMFKTQN